MNVYDFMVLDRQGNSTSLKQFEGKVLLIVNTATGCGFTPQYEGLQKLYEKYHDQGFEILDFPCNQFFRQAPGSDEEIHQFCTLRYHTTFPRFKKINVNGKEADPLYNYLCAPDGGKRVNIKWNFTKFLIDRNGQIVARFEPTAKPEDFAKQIEGLLK